MRLDRFFTMAVYSFYQPRPGGLLFVLLPLLFSCSKGPPIVEKPKAAGAQFSRQTYDMVFSCLEENLLFLNQMPNTMKEFVLKIGKASKICEASNEDIKTYVGKLLKNMGALYEAKNEKAAHVPTISYSPSMPAKGHRPLIAEPKPVELLLITTSWQFPA